MPEPEVALAAVRSSHDRLRSLVAGLTTDRLTRAAGRAPRAPAVALARVS
jgi:hypothetical protein